MATEAVIAMVRDYARLVGARFPVKQVVLFGSFARGTQRDDSDIDVAVVLKEQPDDVLRTETELYKLRRQIDLRIEPVLVEEDWDPSGFWEEISSYGTVIYSAV